MCICSISNSSLWCLWIYTTETSSGFELKCEFEFILMNKAHTRQPDHSDLNRFTMVIPQLKDVNKWDFTWIHVCKHKYGIWYKIFCAFDCQFCQNCKRISDSFVLLVLPWLAYFSFWLLDSFSNLHFCPFLLASFKSLVAACQKRGSQIPQELSTHFLFLPFTLSAFWFFGCWFFGNFVVCSVKHGHMWALHGIFCKKCSPFSI